jgi:hypothetical protein
MFAALLLAAATAVPPCSGGLYSVRLEGDSHEAPYQVAKVLAVEPPLGPPGDVQQRLAGALGPLAWSTHDRTLFGRAASGAEVQLTPDPDALCRFVTVRRVTPDEVARACRALGTIGFDNQAGTIVYR